MAVVCQVIMLQTFTFKLQGRVKRILVLAFILHQASGQEPLSPPSVNDQGQPVLGFNFSLSCIALRLPVHVRVDDLTFAWFRNDTQLEGARDLTLTFDQVKRSDEGRYTCRVSLGSPQTTSPQSKPFHLGVLIHPNVTIEPDSVVRVALGDSLNLTCVVREAYPRVLDDGYSWSYRPSSSTEWQRLANKGHFLTFTNVTREDAGHYRCQARNDAGVEGKIPPGEASVSVEVLYLEKLTLTPDLEVNEGDYVMLACSVDSNPAARLSWLVEGREVRHVTYNVDHYVLERAACSDNKTYTCRASNAELPGLERHASTHVLVNCTKKDSLVASTTSKDLDVPGQDGADGMAAENSCQVWLPWMIVFAAPLGMIPILAIFFLIRRRRKRQRARQHSSDAAQDALRPRDTSF